MAILDRIPVECSCCGCAKETDRKPRRENVCHGKPVPKDWRDSRPRGLSACYSGLQTVTV
jgi:hypothetical protein